ncbi:MAG TPA: UDP-glucose/GDP-mannose dehydrogenase family protein [Gemmatimonadales bacterium]|nr:UDP-glucose/GDP-mannose dehydrogenase family protein [Gemmatimonadales bacterium]
MKLAVVGTGYVGLVVGACLAETGNDVICVDRDAAKIDGLRRNRLPIYEPGLEPLVVRNQRDGRLQFDTDVGAAVERSDAVVIAVGTPPNEDGSADLQHVLDVARIVGRHMNRPKVVITKSTVPVGTAERVRAEIAKQTTSAFHVCANPEFLKEGAAVEDFMKPDRVVVGVDGPEATEILGELYAPFVRTGNPIIFMDLASAEMTKYAANGMLATRVSFMNQIARLCDAVGADVTLVRKGIAADRRIGPAFLFPGPGYGGSCLPKDVRALVRTGHEKGVPLDILEAVEAANERQKRVLFEKLERRLGGAAALRGATIAVWGLAFKAETDDVRDSPALALVEQLLAAGAKVRLHDPAALASARRHLGDRVTYTEHAYDALTDATALVIVTEWLEYRNPDFERIKRALSRPLIIDGRNLYDPQRLARLGFVYESIGRPAPAPPAGCASS